MPVSVALCENKYISLSQHTFSAHMSKMAQVREKRMGGGNFGKKGGKRQIEERGEHRRNMRTLHPFIHMHALRRTSSVIHHKSPIHTH